MELKSLRRYWVLDPGKFNLLFNLVPHQGFPCFDVFTAPAFPQLCELVHGVGAEPLHGFLTAVRSHSALGSREMSVVGHGYRFQEMCTNTERWCLRQKGWACKFSVPAVHRHDTLVSPQRRKGVFLPLFVFLPRLLARSQV